MPAKSKAQQHLMGAAYAVKTGQASKKDASPEVRKLLRGMSEKELREYASTQTKGLPRHVGGHAGARLRRVRSA